MLQFIEENLLVFSPLEVDGQGSLVGWLSSGMLILILVS